MEVVEVTLVEMDAKTDSLKVVLYGSGIDYRVIARASLLARLPLFILTRSDTDSIHLKP